MTDDDGRGVPSEVYIAWLYGVGGIATGRHMRVKSRLGHNYSSAHAGSAAASPRTEDPAATFERVMDSAGVTPLQRLALRFAAEIVRQCQRVNVAEIARRMEVAPATARQHLEAGKRRLRQSDAAVALFGWGEET